MEEKHKQAFIRLKDIISKGFISRPKGLEIRARNFTPLLDVIHVYEGKRPGCIFEEIKRYPDAEKIIKELGLRVYGMYITKDLKKESNNAHKSLGYPKCCIKAYKKKEFVEKKILCNLGLTPEIHACQIYMILKKVKDGKINNSNLDKLKDYAFINMFISHSMCKIDCKKSLNLAMDFLTTIKEYNWLLSPKELFEIVSEGIDDDLRKCINWLLREEGSSKKFKEFREKLFKNNKFLKKLKIERESLLDALYNEKKLKEIVKFGNQYMRNTFGPNTMNNYLHIANKLLNG